MAAKEVRTRQARQVFLIETFLAALLSLFLCGSSIAKQSNDNNLNVKPLNEVSKTKVIKELMRAMNTHYVFPAVAQRANQMLETNLKHGEYKKIRNHTQFAQTLTNQLQQETKDRHLAVRFEDPLLDELDRQGEPSEEDTEKVMLAETYTPNKNQGIERIGRLPGNIGYLDFRVFGLTDYASPAIATAMQLFESSDALIIDLRKNGGGVPGTVYFFESYFVAPGTRLNDIYNREDGKTTQHWSLASTPTPRYDSKKKVYLLTSAATFSGGEDFAYTLQALKRSIIIGEVTGGGAHPTKRLRLSHNMAAHIPFSYSINPITKGNWEGVGVQPEIRIDRAQALKTAYLEALNVLIETEKDVEKKKDLQRIREQLKG